ncbi:uncharacterized protein LOC121876143 [Homarus americanus]|uniref:uncharacterized protein LOC121876143 n=1 Tax=Homarus americanus TaxID=6706 RepID=UPI001C454AD6|nr:uncharacterized protein LOC121876143 [Homarus americanus]
MSMSIQHGPITAILHPWMRPSRSTTDVIYAARQIQENYEEHRHYLYMAFIDFNNAFDPVNMKGLWWTLSHFCSPPKFMIIVRHHHDGMKGSVLHNEGPPSAPELARHEVASVIRQMKEKKNTGPDRQLFTGDDCGMPHFLTSLAKSGESRASDMYLLNTPKSKTSQQSNSFKTILISLYLSH